MIDTVATWAARLAATVVPGVVGRIPVDTQTAFLTFDDGPSLRTSELLVLLRDSQAKATFFLLGSRIERYDSIVREITGAGHGVGNHSYQHLDAWRYQWKQVENDLDRGNRALEDVVGTRPLWMRPPFGRFRPSTLSWCKRNGQSLALWDVMAGDFIPGVNTAEVSRRVIDNVRPGSIIVLHDGDRHQPQAVEIARRIVYRLVESGWSLDRLPDPLFRST